MFKEFLKDYLNIIYNSIVTFSTKADLKVNVKSDVVYNSRLLRAIRKYQIEVLSKDEVEKIYILLLTVNIKDKTAKKEHVKVIRNNINERKKKIKKGYLPKM